MSCDDVDPEQLACDSTAFSRRVIELLPDQELPMRPGAWGDAIVFLTAGEIELECVSGQRRRFACEAIVCFAQTVRLVRNQGTEPARLIAISRRSQPPQHQR